MPPKEGDASVAADIERQLMVFLSQLTIARLANQPTMSEVAQINLLTFSRVAQQEALQQALPENAELQQAAEAEADPPHTSATIDHLHSDFYSIRPLTPAKLFLSPTTKPQAPGTQPA